MAPASPVKGYCMRYDVKKAKSRQCCALLSGSILFFVGSWDWKGEVTFLRILENSTRVLLIIIAPLPSPSVISLVIYLCEGAEGWCENCDAHNSVSIFSTIVGFRKEYSSLQFIVQLSWRYLLYFFSTKAIFFLGVFILSITFRSFEFCPTMWFSASLSFDCHLQTPGQPDGVTWIGPGGPCIWKILAGSLAGWCRCALGLLQWSNQERRGKSASLCEVKALMLKCEWFHPDVKWSSEVLAWEEVVGFGFT